MSKRKIEYRVIWSLLNTTSQVFISEKLASFESYEEAENHIMECEYPSELQIQKVYVYE